MTALVDGARRLLGRRAESLPDRLEALRLAADTGRGRLPDPLVARAEAVVDRAQGRLGITGDHTVVALAGATGSGKSSTFNALAGSDLSAVGVRRPTTSVTSAVTFGDDDPAEVLAWLEVGRWHRSEATWAPAGLVLLDLPDHDSTQVEHHVEVDRLVERVDMLVWVLDPQKYADAAVHERYLRPLAGHGEVMIVTLNHIDEVPVERRGSLVRDLRRRLAEDGLPKVPVIATSARLRSGDGDSTPDEGIAELRTLVAGRAESKRVAAARLAADVSAAAAALAEANGRVDPSTLRRADRAELVSALADAAGVPTVVRAVDRSVRRRGGRHTGWPVTAWLSRFKPDPLRRLHLDVGDEDKRLVALGRASVPEPTRVQRARVDLAVREVAVGVGERLAPAWADSVREASTSRLTDLGDALDRAVVGTDLGVSRRPLWWPVARFLQVLLAATALVGVLWLGALALVAYLQLDVVLDPPERNGLPLPTLLLLLGVVGGICLAVVGKSVNALVARSRARGADRRLRESIGRVADELVIAPIDAELAAYSEVRRALQVAAG